jgi:hypothetical protein
MNKASVDIVERILKELKTLTPISEFRRITEEIGNFAPKYEVDEIK